MDSLNQRNYMSQWVKIAGTILFEKFEISSIDAREDVIVSGYVSTLCSDDRKTQDECTVPYGSEGKLEHFIMPESGVVVFYGALRDKGDEIVDEMQEYLARISKDQMISQGIFEIVIGGEKKVIFQYEQSDEKWKIIYC